MKKHLKWLIAEIDQWVKDGIIEPQQGPAIKARYPEPGQGLAWDRIIFFSIGAILFGPGVILLFAYNRQRMRLDLEFASQHLGQKDIIWQGYMPSRVFHGRGQID